MLSQDLYSISNLAASEREALAALGTVPWPKKSVLYLAGDEARTIYIVRSGQVKLSCVSNDGRAITLCFRQPGEIFGEAALFSQSHRLEMAECNQGSDLLAIETTDMLEFLRAHPAATLALLNQSVKMTTDLSRKISALMFQNVAAKVADALLRYYRQPSEPGQPLLTHRDLANIIGSTRETVSATLSRFRSQGLISGNRGSLAIRDVDGLTRLASSGNGSS